MPCQIQVPLQSTSDNHLWQTSTYEQIKIVCIGRQIYESKLINKQHTQQQQFSADCHPPYQSPTQNTICPTRIQHRVDKLWQLLNIFLGFHMSLWYAAMESDQTFARHALEHLCQDAGARGCKRKGDSKRCTGTGSGRSFLTSMITTSSWLCNMQLLAKHHWNAFRVYEVDVNDFWGFGKLPSGHLWAKKICNGGWSVLCGNKAGVVEMLTNQRVLLGLGGVWNPPADFWADSLHRRHG